MPYQDTQPLISITPIKTTKVLIKTTLPTKDLHI